LARKIGTLPQPCAPASTVSRVLLRLHQESTARIAERVGIANPFDFSRLFSGRFGCAPTQYRARYASKTGSKTALSQHPESDRALQGPRPGGEY